MATLSRNKYGRNAARQDIASESLLPADSLLILRIVKLRGSDTIPRKRIETPHPNPNKETTLVLLALIKELLHILKLH
jgi:hypothetical protein